jgi:hypothetical protein
VIEDGGACEEPDSSGGALDGRGGDSPA